MTEAYGVIHEGQMARAKEQLGVKGQNLFELYQFVTRERPEILDCEIEFVTSCSSPENQNPDTFRITVGAWRPPNVDDGIAGLFIDIEGGLAKVASLHPIRKASKLRVEGTGIEIVRGHRLWCSKSSCLFPILEKPPVFF